MQKSISFTKEGLEALQTEKDSLNETRKAAVLDLKKAREMGDLSENGYYKAAKFHLLSVDRRIREVKRLLSRGFTPERNDAKTVQFGSTVVLSTKKTQVTYRIVGKYESDPQKGRISIESPLGKVIMGKRTGDIAQLRFGGEQTDYIIKSITNNQ